MRPLSANCWNSEIPDKPAFNVPLTIPVTVSATATAAEPSPASGQVAKAAPAKATNQADARKKPAARKDEAEIDIASAISTEIQCELGNKLTIYRNAHNDQEISLRWKQKLSKLQRVATTTGANRFEDKASGLVWIDIPAKGMLLDSKQGRQLANECIHARR